MNVLSVAIVGGGVIGLGTAIRIAEEYGESVSITVFCDPQRQTSSAAGAFWYPFAFGATDALQKDLATPTLQYLLDHQEGEDDSSPIRSGCRSSEGYEYFNSTYSRYQATRTPWWASVDSLSFQEADIPGHIRALGYDRAWKFETALISMRDFLPWLEEQLDFASPYGVIFSEVWVDDISELAERYDIVVNCSGGWAAELVGDPVITGYKGVLLRAEVKGSTFPLVFAQQGLCPSSSTMSEECPTYIIPHNDCLILGGSYEKRTKIGTWSESPEDWIATDAEISSIHSRCEMLCPSLRDIPRSEFTPIGALRPLRPNHGPRIGKDSDFSNVFHNFGHGGAGVTTFWGSAELVVSSINESVTGLPSNARKRQSA